MVLCILNCLSPTIESLFVNILPGSELDVRKLMGKWGMSFPRSWSLGISLNS